MREAWERVWSRVEKAAWENTQCQQGPDPAQHFPLPCCYLLQIGRIPQEMGSAQNSWRSCSAGKAAWCSVHFIHPRAPRENGDPAKPLGLANRAGLAQPIRMCSMKYLGEHGDGFGRGTLAPDPGNAASRWHSYAALRTRLLSCAPPLAERVVPLSFKLPWET